MREPKTKDIGEVLSGAMVDLMERFERWDQMHYLGSAKVEWVEFVEELDKFNTVVRELDKEEGTW